MCWLSGIDPPPYFYQSFLSTHPDTNNLIVSHVARVLKSTQSSIQINQLICIVYLLSSSPWDKHHEWEAHGGNIIAASTEHRSRLTWWYPATLLQWDVAGKLNYKQFSPKLRNKQSILNWSNILVETTHASQTQSHILCYASKLPQWCDLSQCSFICSKKLANPTCCGLFYV